MSTGSELAIALAGVARSLPVDQLELAANTLSRLHVLGPEAIEALCALVPTEHFRAQMEQVVKAWEKAPELDGAAVSLALRSGISLPALHRQLRGISSDRAVGLGPNKVMSVPDAIGLALEECDESVFWMEFLRDAELIGPVQAAHP